MLRLWQALREVETAGASFAIKKKSRKKFVNR